MRIALTGGGSGGHFFPLIAVAREIKNLINGGQQSAFLAGEKIGFMFIGPKTVGDEALAADGISRKTILTGKFRRYASIKNLFDVFKLPAGFFQSLWHLFWFMPNVVFSKGGYGSVPVVLAAWIFRIPVLTHESDSVPGLANKISAKLSKKIAVAFKSALPFFPAKKTALTGNPVRQELLTGSREEGLKFFKLAGQKPVVFIAGGSQGSQIINDAVFAAMPSLLIMCDIIHQCGRDKYDSFFQLIGDDLSNGYVLMPFLDEIQEKNAYAAADLIVSRAGANNITEIAALGKPSIIIPIAESGGNHQYKNALEYSEYGGCEIVEQANLTPHLFVNRVGTLLNDKNLLKKMGENAKLFYHADAGERVAKEILEIAKY